MHFKAKRDKNLKKKKPFLNKFWSLIIQKIWFKPNVSLIKPNITSQYTKNFVHNIDEMHKD